MDILRKEKTETSNKGLISRRTEERIAVDLPVDITRYDEEGNACTERTRIDDVTSVGCRFRTQAELQHGDIVSVKALGRGENNRDDEQPQLFEIMWAAPQGTGWAVGARKLAGEKLATVTFPPANHSASPTSK
jgi:hypothetical protein